MIDQDMELWDITTKTPRVPMKRDSARNDVQNFEYEYTQSDLEAMSKNYRAINHYLVL